MKISRSKIDLFISCPRCFYLDMKNIAKRPPGFPFSLNNAVDGLLKKEFDFHRERGTPHPLQAHLNLIPANHPSINKWRDSLRGGVAYEHPSHDCTYYGGIDDLWIDANNTYYVVDYKATAKAEPVSVMPDWADGYRRQAEIYQWLLRKNGLTVSDTAYFVYCTGKKNQDRFDQQLLFDIHVIPYIGSDTWVEQTLEQLQLCLNSEQTPPLDANCPYCKFVVQNK
jgi:PD-(D/E)XK nuclease superfamily